MLEMINAFVSGFFQVFVGNTFELMLLGIFIGFIVGILPGLGGPTALALMLPFIIKMNPFEAFAFLLGMASVTNTTGDITSIVIGVPGEPTTVATIVDGHSMTKKGEGGRALGAALMSSLVGAIFGAFVLALAIPIVSPVVRLCGSPEFFMLALLGITFVASLSGEAIVKGLISGGLGLLLATVGLSQISGIERYTFGQLFLWDGVGLVGLALGFFAIPEIIDLAVGGTSIAGEQVGKLGGVMEGIKDTFRHFWLVMRCSAIGAFVAFIPGLGAATSQWLSYAHAAQSAKSAEERAGFGKGDVRGVLGPGAANNSSLGGSLAMTVAFGIPASVIMAILLGAFIIQGIQPGPDMLIPEARGGHLTLTFSFVWINVVANIITVGICLLILKQIVRVTQIRGSLVIPYILLLIYLGAFAEKNVFQDLYQVLLFGLAGWVMVRFNWPRAPLCLGLVLGPMAENRLFLSYDNYGSAFLLRPGVLLVIALILVGVFYSTFRARRKQRERGKDEPLATKAVTRDGTRFWRFSWATLFSLFIVAMFIFALWDSRNFGIRAGLFPWIICFPVLALAIAQLLMDLTGQGERKDDSLACDLPTNIINRRTAGIFGWLFGYFVAILLFGFPIGLSLSIFLHLKIGSREKWPITLMMSGFAWVFIYILFDRVMHVPFPTGKLFIWLQLTSI